jgi:hypothetical protein
MVMKLCRFPLHAKPECSRAIAKAWDRGIHSAPKNPASEAKRNELP